jgi:hypothetical protein
MLGLAESITAGFAGLNGGLPFLMVGLTVMTMALYEFYDETVCKFKD